MISFEDFEKVELKTGKILEAESIEGSEKLLKLQVDLGEKDPETNLPRSRQILAGIAKFYKTEELIGKVVVIAANLEPRKMMGLESQGMLLAADGEEKPIILTTSETVKPGARIR